MSTPAHILAWQHWFVRVPGDWNPVRIDGDADRGSVVLADLARTRMALRWQRVSKRWDVERGQRQALVTAAGRDAVGEASEFTASDDFTRILLHEPKDADAPERAFLHSRISNRLLEIVRVRHESDGKQTPTLRRDLLASMRDQQPDDEVRWRVFEMDVMVPGGFGLKSRSLAAGDLTLSFEKKREVIAVRVICPARLALSRQPLERWMQMYGRGWRATHRPRRSKMGVVEAWTDPDAQTDETEVADPINRLIVPRRRRLFFARWIARQRVILARVVRDRILLADGATDARALDMLESMEEMMEAREE